MKNYLHYLNQKEPELYMKMFNSFSPEEMKKIIDTSEEYSQHSANVLVSGNEANQISTNKVFGEVAVLPSEQDLYYHYENIGVAKTFRDIKTERWYYEDELVLIFGKQIVERIKLGKTDR